MRASVATSVVQSALRCIVAVAAMSTAAGAVAATGVPVPLRVGVYDNPPKVTLEHDGRPSGIYVDVLEHAARQEGWQVRYVRGTFEEGLARLERGDLDLMVDVAKTPERLQRFDFNAEPVLHSWNEVYARRELGIRYMAQLAGRRVGVLNGSVQQALFSDAADAWGVQSVLVPFDTFEEAFAAAEDQRVDAVVANPFFGAQRGGMLSQTAIVFGSYSLHYAGRKGASAPVLAALDRHLAALKADPSSSYSLDFEALVRGQRPATLPAWVVPGAAGGLLLVLVVLGWAVSARRAAGRLGAAESLQRQLADERMELLRCAEVRERQLQQANEDLQIISYSLSHDLRSPLAAVQGFVAAVRDRASHALDPRSQGLLDRSLAAAGRMDHMVRDLGALLKVAGQNLELGECDLTALAHEVAGDLRAHREGQPEIVIADGLRAQADPKLMRVVLENLLGNAWKFSSRLERPRIEFGRQAGGPAYFVRDNGAGFSMEFANKLFHPFSRLHAHEEYPGTGMGLSIVKRIVARHGGRVWAESEVGHGATFYFTLGAE